MLCRPDRPKHISGIGVDRMGWIADAPGWTFSGSKTWMSTFRRPTPGSRAPCCRAAGAARHRHEPTCGASLRCARWRLVAAAARVRFRYRWPGDVAKTCTSSEVELLKLRQLTIERTAELKIHKYRQQDQRGYGGYAYEARHAGGSAIDRAPIGPDYDVC